MLALCFLHAEQREAAIRLRLAEEGEGADRREIELADPLPEHVRWLPVCAALAFIVVGEQKSRLISRPWIEDHLQSSKFIDHVCRTG